MLAYILWHRPRSGSAVRTMYEAGLLAFHEGLNKSNIPGFVRSSTHGVSPLPWLRENGCHEDWYLLSDWVALGTLNEAAVQGSHKTPHDLAAHSAVVEAGALYSLKSGTPQLDSPAALWFSKPDNMAYWVLWELLEPLTGPSSPCGIWQRQLALGPAPEFCVLGEAELITDAFSVIRSKRTKIVNHTSLPLLH